MCASNGGSIMDISILVWVYRSSVLDTVRVPQELAVGDGEGMRLGASQGGSIMGISVLKWV